jgi:hypothetical protein
MEEVKLELFKVAIKCLQAPLPINEHAAGRSTISDAAVDDEIGLFVRSIESTLRRMSGRQLALARKRINDVMFEVEMEAYNVQSTPFNTGISSAHQTDLQQNSYSSQASSLPFNSSPFNWPCNSMNVP